MHQLYAIGEALIDFISKERDAKLKEVTQFGPQVGGAPANVASCVAKLGRHASLITQVGQDAFGEKIIDTLTEVGVDTRYILQTSQANTALAFVSLTQTGERDFAFYRKPSADMLLKAEQVQDIHFDKTDILHFCSVDLVPSAMKTTHEAIIEKMIEAQGTIVFDPNLRFPLWDSKEELKHTVRAFIPKAHVLKIADDELEFITGITDQEAAVQSLFEGNVEIVIVTQGKDGASLYTNSGKAAEHPGFNIEVKDTTGAGDAFIGAILYQLLGNNREDLAESAYDFIKFANAVGALTTMHYGAIGSLPELSKVNAFLEEH